MQITVNLSCNRYMQSVSSYLCGPKVKMGSRKDFGVRTLVRLRTYVVGVHVPRLSKNTEYDIKKMTEAWFEPETKIPMPGFAPAALPLSPLPQRFHPRSIYFAILLASEVQSEANETPTPNQDHR
jgi:hypothetical protein